MVPVMSLRRSVAMFLVALTVALGASLAGCGDDVEGKPCTSRGARMTRSDGSVYECLPVEPSRPQDGLVWHKVTTR